VRGEVHTGGFRKNQEEKEPLGHKVIKNNIKMKVPVIATTMIGLEVNAEKTKYIVMSRDQNPGQNEYIQIGNKSFETVEV
jgi:hypothetical protein